MKFPSVHQLTQGAVNVLKRFPLEVMFALAGTIAGIVNIELNKHYTEPGYIQQTWCWRIIAGANLGLLLALAATLYSESQQWAVKKKWLLRLAAVVVTLAIAATISPFERTTDAIRFFLLSFAFHLLVAFAAFGQRGTAQGFWQFNKTLFLRFLTSALYSAVLFLGLSAAIAATNFLFNLKIEWDTYVILWTCIVGVFSTVFFLAGVPSNYTALNEDHDYPKGLKVFTQYVLIPLATVYVAILLAYEAKIIIQWQLPKGLVSKLILGYAVFGILSILLVYPIRTREDSKWIKTYAKSFYLLMLPLIALLFVAMSTRVFKYGVTEFRYFLIVLAFWMLFISLYYLLSAQKNIKLIPVSLCVLTLLAVYGPISAFSVSVKSQMLILKDIFVKNHAFKNGTLQPVTDSVSKKDGNHAVAVIDYLVEHHDITSLQPSFKQDLQHVADSLSHIKTKEHSSMSRYALQSLKLDWVKKQLNLDDFWGRWSDRDDETEVVPEEKTTQIRLNSTPSDVFEIKGYDYLLEVSMNNIIDTPDISTGVYELKQGTVTYTNAINNIILIKIDGKTVKFNLTAWVNNLMNDTEAMKKYKDHASNGEYMTAYNIPVSNMQITQYAGRHMITLKINQANLVKLQKVNKYQLNFAEGALLIKW